MSKTEQCPLCDNKGAIDIVESWHELTVWCILCHPDLFEEAAVAYLANYGIDFRPTVMDYMQVILNQKK